MRKHWGEDCEDRTERGLERWAERRWPGHRDRGGEGRVVSRLLVRGLQCRGFPRVHPSRWGLQRAQRGAGRRETGRESGRSGSAVRMPEAASGGAWRDLPGGAKEMEMHWAGRWGGERQGPA